MPRHLALRDCAAAISKCPLWVSFRGPKLFLKKTKLSVYSREPCILLPLRLETRYRWPRSRTQPGTTDIVPSLARLQLAPQDLHQQHQFGLVQRWAPVLACHIEKANTAHLRLLGTSVAYSSERVTPDVKRITSPGHAPGFVSDMRFRYFVRRETDNTNFCNRQAD